MRFFLFLAVLAGFIGAAGYFGLRSFNHFDEIEREFAGQCTPFTGIAGPEDIEIDHERGLAFISSLDRRADGPRGAIHLVNLDEPLDGAGFVDRTGGEPEAFKPFGIAYYEDDEVRRLFVVNSAANSVELFDVDEDGALVHIETFAERRLTSPNNIVAVGPRQFYVTNDVKPGRTTRAGGLHFLFRATSGEVFFVDGDTWRLAAEGLRFANGITASDDGAKIYVAETASNTVRVYSRDLETDVLALSRTIKIDAAPDNLSIDTEGHIWIAALPKPLSAPSHGKNPAVHSPSAVIRIGGNDTPELIYRDSGAEISAATVAAKSGRTMLIGGLYDAKFLICRLPPDNDPA
ncbi:MAG: hypothetical protein HKP25_08865 [Marinicaulis sp.]|nr:hypothetical protein [Marinicaulis sp.]